MNGMKLIPLSEKSILEGLGDGTESVGVRLYEETDSTNRQARLLWDGVREKGNVPSATLLVARRQTAGRGRLGREFFSPRDSGLYMTLLCPTELPLNRAVGVTAATAVCTCRAVEMLTGLTPGIKWVNDIYLHDCKVVGILCEYFAPVREGMPGGLAVGIGVNLTTDNFPGNLRAPAASLADFAPRETVLDAGLLCGRIAGGILSLLLTDSLFCAETLDAYRTRLLWVGQKVSCIRGSDSFTGILRGVDDAFRLSVETDGGIRMLDSGDISVRALPQDT